MIMIKCLLEVFNRDGYAEFISDSDFILRVKPFNGIIKFGLCEKTECKKDSSFVVNVEEYKTDEYEIIEEKNKFILLTGDLRIVLYRNPFYIEIFNKTGDLLLEDDNEFPYEKKRGVLSVRKKIKPAERFYGFGEKAGKLEKTGSKMVMWNTDYLESGFRKYISQEPLYISIPFFIAVSEKSLYGLFFDNCSKLYYDVGKSKKSVFRIKAESGDIVYYFINGKKIGDIIEKYTELTGRIKMPPLWSLGYHQSRWGYESEKKVNEIAGKFRKKNIPCDCIHFDIEHMQGYRVFTWNRKRYKNHKNVIKGLKKKGFKTVVIVDPGVKTDDKYSVYQEGKKGYYFCTHKDGSPFYGKVWPGKVEFPDFFRKETRKWWGNLYRKYTDDGVEGFWNDMNEPANSGLKFTGYHKTEGRLVEHRKVRNLYGQMMVRSIHEGLMKRENRRRFILTRSGFAGIQKYSAVWTGDCHSNWADLRVTIPMILNLGLSGVPFIGSDIGGFEGDTNKELFIRWMQAGIFFPFFRNHTRINTRHQEPWSFGEKTENICRELIQFRYRFLPYLYSLFYEAYKRGYPIIRPLFFHYPGDENTFFIEDQFLFGENILIAPILYSGKREREVYLPEDKWIDLHTNDIYKGGCSYNIKKPVDQVIMFIKAGSIIPFYETVNYIGEREYDKLYLNIYPGTGEFLYYEDDGDTFNYEKGGYNLIKFEQETEGKTGIFKILPQKQKYKSPLNTVHFKFFGILKDIESDTLEKIKLSYDEEKKVSYFTLKIKFPLKDRMIKFKME